MKKSLNALLVIVLSLVGANALAAKLDQSIKKCVIESSDTSATGNGSGIRNAITKRS